MREQDEEDIRYHAYDTEKWLRLMMHQADAAPQPWRNQIREMGMKIRDMMYELYERHKLIENYEDLWSNTPWDQYLRQSRNILPVVHKTDIAEHRGDALAALAAAYDNDVIRLKGMAMDFLDAAEQVLTDG